MSSANQCESELFLFVGRLAKFRKDAIKMLVVNEPRLPRGPVGTNIVDGPFSFVGQENQRIMLPSQEGARLGQLEQLE